MNWMDQTQDMLKVWMESTEKMWKGWTEAMGEKPADGAWDRTLKTWENSFKNFIETQALWARMWVRNTMAGMEGEQSEAFVNAVEESTKLWTETQQMLWNNWAQMIKQLDPSKLMDSVDTDGKKMMDAWQEQMQQVMTMQTEWSKQMMDMMKKAE